MVLDRLELLKRIKRTKNWIKIEASKPPDEDRNFLIEVLEEHLFILKKVLEQLIN